MMQLFAIVPMKAHSERVANKNIREFNGKPLFYWIFNTLNRVGKISGLILDTDSEQIAEMVKSYFDVDVSFRPQPLRGDFVSMNRIIEHVISLYPEQPYFLQTHVTNPLLKKETIEKAIETFFHLKVTEYDSLVSVNRYQS
jgi:CMP-N-acetylneuraminic acid synthetase